MEQIYTDRKMTIGGNLRTFFFFSFILSWGYVGAQINIMSNVAKANNEEYKYDSLFNMSRKPYGSKYTYHYLIGQTLMFCGDPYLGAVSNGFTIGNYYKVEGVMPDDTARGKYNRLSLSEIKTGLKFEENGFTDNKYNYRWVVLGHYEKIKALYVGKEFVYIDNTKNLDPIFGKADFLLNLETNAICRVDDKSIWKCVDVQVKPRQSDDYMERDRRSPIVLVVENPKYGKCYCYLEDLRGVQHSPISNSEFIQPLICWKFQLKSTYDRINSLSKVALQKRKAFLSKKFGASNANLIIKGIIKIGMTKAMCEEAWGKPDKINTTLTSKITQEQWVYGSRYVYFDGNRLSAIQNW